jgi:hypothetical protein
MKPITENIIEESAIEILQSQGWEYANGKEIVFNNQQIFSLTQPGDTLLPKFMNGEICLSNFGVVSNIGKVKLQITLEYENFKRTS